MIGMGGGGLGRAVVEILGNDAELKAVLAEDEAALKSFSRTGSSSFNGTSKGAALASKAISGVGIAAAATIVVGAGMAAQFDKTFAQIGSLAGKLGMPMDQAKAHVLDLAKATGQDPNGLASALYFAASAGLQASQVMPVLDASAKAAAMGMGDAQTVAQTLTSVLNAYKGTGLDTAGVMNIMTAAVKDGKAEMSDFATGLGPVISVAANAGVSFNDMAAGLAEATNQGVPFSRAVTGMRFLIQSLEAPTDKASKALDAIGLSADDVAKMLTQPGGLEKAIQLIHDRTDAMGSDGRKAWAAITGGARGSIVAVDLVGKHTADTNRIVADLGRSAQKGAKDFSNAWGKISQTDAVKFQQAVADVKVALIQLGEKALPLLGPLIHDLGAVMSAVIPLAPALVALWAAFKGYTVVRSAAAALGGFEVAAGAASTVLTGATAVIAGAAGEVFLLVGAIKSAIDYHQRLAAEVTAETAQIIAGKDATGALTAAKVHLNAVDKVTATLTQVVAGETRSLTKGGYVPLAGAIQNVNDQQGVLNKAQDAAAAKLKNLGAETVFTKVGMQSLADATAHAGGSTHALTGATKGAAAAAKSATGPTNALAAASRNAAAAAKSQFLAEETLAGGVLGIVAAEQQAKSGEQTLAKLRATGKKGTLEYSQAVQQQAGNVLALAVAVSNYEKDNKGATGSMQAQLGPLSALFSKYGVTAGMLNQLAGSAANAKSQVDGVAASVNNLHDKTITITVAQHYLTPTGLPIGGTQN